MNAAPKIKQSNTPVIDPIHTCRTSFLYTLGSLVAPPNPCLRNAKSTDTTTTASKDSLNTMKKIWTLKTFTMVQNCRPDLAGPETEVEKICAREGTAPFIQ